MKKKTTYLATLILFALGLMSACTPGELDGDDNSNPDATPVPLAATVSLPATGTVTRANATTGSIKFDVSGSSFTLRRYDHPDRLRRLRNSRPQRQHLRQRHQLAILQAEDVHGHLRQHPYPRHPH